MGKFFQLSEVKVIGEQPGANIECVCHSVSKADIDSFGSFVNDPVHFQSPTGKTVGAVTGLSIMGDGSAILRAKITDAVTKTFVTEGDLTGVLLNDEGQLSLVDRCVSKAATFNLRRYSDSLAKRFTGRNVNALLPADASCRNGLSRDQNAAVYQAMLLKSRLNEISKMSGHKPRQNYNQRLTEQ